MHTQTILTIEDDAAIRRGVVDALTFAGYQVIEAAATAPGVPPPREPGNRLFWSPEANRVQSIWPTRCRPNQTCRQLVG